MAVRWIWIYMLLNQNKSWYFFLTLELKSQHWFFSRSTRSLRSSTISTKNTDLFPQNRLTPVMFEIVWRMKFFSSWKVFENRHMCRAGKNAALCFFSIVEVRWRRFLELTRFWKRQEKKLVKPCYWFILLYNRVSLTGVREPIARGSPDASWSRNNWRSW